MALCFREEFKYNENRQGEPVKDCAARVFLFVVGLLGLSWPLVKVFSVSVVFYVFALWSLLILLALVLQSLAETAGREGGKRQPPV